MTALRSNRHIMTQIGVCAAICLFIPVLGHAQVTTTVTPDASLTTPSVVTDLGVRVDVTGGTRPGNGTNLFHSFAIFDVATGDIVNFLNCHTK